MSNSPVKSNPHTRAMRREEVMRLALSGLNDARIHALIGERFGVSQETLRQDRVRVLGDAAVRLDDADKLLAQHKLRYEQVLGKFFEKAASGDENAARILFQGMSRYERVMGWQKPTRVALGGDPDAPPIETITREVDLSKLTMAELLEYRRMQAKMEGRTTED